MIEQLNMQEHFNGPSQQVARPAKRPIFHRHLAQTSDLEREEGSNIVLRHGFLAESWEMVRLFTSFKQSECLIEWQNGTVHRQLLVQSSNLLSDS